MTDRRDDDWGEDDWRDDDWRDDERWARRPTDPDASSSRWTIPIVAFVLAAVLPSAYFLSVGFPTDNTATGDATSTVAVLIAIDVGIGLVLGFVAWATSGSASPTVRQAWKTLVVIAAIASGLLTGVFGGVAIAMARHPTWDDA